MIGSSWATVAMVAVMQVGLALAYLVVGLSS